MNDHVVIALTRARDERDRMIRLFNRLDAAVTHHQHATGPLADTHDDSLYAARARIITDWHEGNG